METLLPGSEAEFAFSVGVVSPIALFTLPATPIHLSISDTEVRVGHYGSFHSETFHLKDARRLTVGEGYRPKECSFHAAKDVLIDFADGRRLRGNSVGDGGTSIREDVMQLADSDDEVPRFEQESNLQSALFKVRAELSANRQ